MKNKSLLIAGILLILSIIIHEVVIQYDFGEIVQFLSTFLMGGLFGIVMVLVIQRGKLKNRKKQGG